jgi:hypothetical protein
MNPHRLDFGMSSRAPIWRTSSETSYGGFFTGQEIGQLTFWCFPSCVSISRGRNS